MKTRHLTILTAATTLLLALGTCSNNNSSDDGPISNAYNTCGKPAAMERNGDKWSLNIALTETNDGTVREKGTTDTFEYLGTSTFACIANELNMPDYIQESVKETTTSDAIHDRSWEMNRAVWTTQTGIPVPGGYVVVMVVTPIKAST